MARLLLLMSFALARKSTLYFLLLLFPLFFAPSFLLRNFPKRVFAVYVTRRALTCTAMNGSVCRTDLIFFAVKINDTNEDDDDGVTPAKLLKFEELLTHGGRRGRRYHIRSPEVGARSFPSCRGLPQYFGYVECFSRLSKLAHRRRSPASAWTSTLPWNDRTDGTDPRFITSIDRSTVVVE